MKTKSPKNPQLKIISKKASPQQHIINALEFLRDESVEKNDATLAVIITNAIVEAKYLNETEEGSYEVVLSAGDQENIHRFLAQFLRMTPDKKEDFFNVIELISDDISNLTLVDSPSAQLN